MPHIIKVLAVASAGGHWAQLQRLAPAFDGCETVFVSTVDPGLSGANARVYVVPDAHRSAKLKLLKLLGAMLRITLVERPDIVISTGAAPGYIAVCCGNLIGARTVWVDSIANVDQLSMSGRLAQRFTDLCLTQWPHLVRPQGPFFAGRVM